MMKRYHGNMVVACGLEIYTLNLTTLNEEIHWTACDECVNVCLSVCLCIHITVSANLCAMACISLCVMYFVLFMCVTKHYVVCRLI